MPYSERLTLMIVSGCLILTSYSALAESFKEKLKETKTLNLQQSPPGSQRKIPLDKPLGKKKTPTQKITSCSNAPQPCANVKDFGARGNGEADDTDAIQQAIDTAAGQASAAQKGTVFFPSGTYMLSRRNNAAALLLRDNLFLVGEQGETEKLSSRQAVTPAAAVSVADSQGQDHLLSRLRLISNQPRWTRMMSTLESEAPALNITIQYLEFDGNEPNQPYQESGERNNIQNHLLFFVGVAGGPDASSKNIVIQDCVLHDSAGSGIRFHSGNHKNVVITRNTIYNVREQYIEFRGSDFEISYNTIKDTLPLPDGTQLGDAAVRAEGGNAMIEPPVSNIKIFGNKIYNTRGGLELDGLVGSEGTGVTSNVEIFENSFEFDFPIQENPYEYGSVIRLHGVRDVVVRANKMKGFVQRGITLVAAENVQILGNFIEGIRKREESGVQFNGIFMMAYQSNATAALPVSDRVFIPTRNVVIKNNVIKDGKRGGIRVGDSGLDLAVGAKDVTIEKNLILNNEEDGISISQAQNIVVLNNDIGYNNNGVSFNYGSNHGKDILFLKNRIYNNKQYGVYVGYYAPKNINFGFSAGTQGPGGKKLGVANIQEGRNCIMKNNVGMRKENTETLSAKNNFWGCAGGPGTAGCDTIELNANVGAGQVTYAPWLASCPQ